jgi:hypothetical protein
MTTVTFFVATDSKKKAMAVVAVAFFIAIEF